MKILILHSKHGDVYYDVSFEMLKFGAALDILETNFKAGFYDEETVVKFEIKKVLSEKLGKKAWHFIHYRADYEYERVSIGNVNQITI
jgi:hypothetical protein